MCCDPQISHNFIDVVHYQTGRMSGGCVLPRRHWITWMLEDLRFRLRRLAFRCSFPAVLVLAVPAPEKNATSERVYSQQAGCRARSGYGSRQVKMEAV